MPESQDSWAVSGLCSKFTFIQKDNNRDSQWAGEVIVSECFNWKIGVKLWSHDDGKLSFVAFYSCFAFISCTDFSQVISA